MESGNRDVVIATKNLTKYYGTSVGIRDVNLEIRRGEIFGFIGPNGAGKSTTIRTLLGLLFPSSGSATVFGLDVVRESKEIKRRVGFMPSDVNYYDDMDSLELLTYSASFYDIDVSGRIFELAERFELDLGKKIIDLSLGNRKKVSLLQAILHAPELLILDEPTTGLDPLMQSRFYEVIRAENERGATVFFSSHLLGEVERMCGRVAIIKEGRVIKVEDIAELRRRMLRKVTLTFTGQVPMEIRALPGVEAVEEKNGHRLGFLFSGRMDTLVKALATHEMEDLVTEEVSLEEVFMHYYGNDGGAEK